MTAHGTGTIYFGTKVTVAHSLWGNLMWHFIFLHSERNIQSFFPIFLGMRGGERYKFFVK